MENFNKTIQQDTPTLVEFYASWCGHCRTMNPIIEELRSLVDGKANIITLDIDDQQNRDLVDLYNIRAVPTLIIFRRGEALWRQSSVVTAYKLESLLTKYGEVKFPEAAETH